MKKTAIFSAFLLCCFDFFSAQEKVIDTVFVFDNQFRDEHKTQQVYLLSNKDIRKNATNLSEALRFQTPIYIKENGRGSVSSPSFRGTTAQQTSFVWNGVTVNSIFLGQGDINNLPLFGYGNIMVKSGGGSIKYGSSAIGGTVHFNNTMVFDKGFGGDFFAELGSFETVSSSLKTSFSNKNFAAAFSAGFAGSENDYEVPEKKYINRNGEYQNETLNFSIGYKLNESNKIFWHSQHFNSVQHFPVFETTQTKTKYHSSSLRSMLQWQYETEKIENRFSAAFLEEGFSYFPNIDNPRASGGNGNTLHIKNDLDFALQPHLKINFIAMALQEKGRGYGSGIQDPERWAGSFAALLKYEKERIYFEAGAKKEFVENMKALFLYSFGGNIKFSPKILLKFKGSKNFRYPTFNDLYWQPGGNLDLKPEISYQAEIGPQIQLGTISFAIIPYFNSIRNMIRWLPGPEGFWTPVNTNRVRIYGLESTMDFRKNFGAHQFLGNLGYSFTKSENVETGFQLSYVPLHKAFGMLTYRYKPMEAYIQGIFNGQTFTTTNESKTNDIEPYFVVNVGVSSKLFKNYQIGLKVSNIMNAVYETMAYYPLPKRNYSMSLSINF